MNANLSLRHTLATLAYRAAKATRDIPDDFSRFRPAQDSRSAGEILSHMCDLMDWALTQARGAEAWQTTQLGDWHADATRLFKAIATLDEYLASGQPLAAPPEKLFQGAVADALTHTGQIAMLRRMAGARVRAENYSKAHIAIGQTQAEQPDPVSEYGK